MQVAALALLAALQGPIIQPEPAPPTPPIAAPRDVPYPGAIRLAVDATDLDRRIFRVRETVPVAGPGPLTLLFPKWLPGNHSPSGPIDHFAGLVVHAGDRRLEWRRDPVEITAFHVDVPAGVTSVEVEFQHLSPTAANQGRIEVTPEMVNLEWNSVVLYPAGYNSRDITVEASARFPEGWGVGTALEPTGPAAAGVTTFKPVPLNTLVDSPILAGRYFQRLDLDPGGVVPVHLDMAADKPEQLVVSPEQLRIHRNLVRQAYKLYGAHHYDHYDFLLSLSEHLGGNGLEHHRSSENGRGANYFTEYDKTPGGRDLLAHEYTHSWNGKFRRAADLYTPNFNVPMRDSLMWVYEGQTQYWGYILAARAGLWNRQEFLDELASTAATYDVRVGRSWRQMQDTTNDPIIANRRPEPWRSWQRSEDYYSEGQLIWLDADTLIRERTGGKKSLDDFARAFFGVDNGSYNVKTYTFDDVVGTLNGVTPYDWATFLNTRLYGHGPGAPLDGIKRGGYALVYTDKPSEIWKQAESQRKYVDLTYSLGFTVGKEAMLGDVLWDGPAFKAGLATGVQIVAVNGLAYDGDALKGAITAAKTTTTPIELLVKSEDRYRTVRIDYHGGLRYPHLEKVAKGAASLDAIYAEKK